MCSQNLSITRRYMRMLSDVAPICYYYVYDSLTRSTLSYFQTKLI